MALGRVDGGRVKGDRNPVGFLGLRAVGTKQIQVQLRVVEGVAQRLHASQQRLAARSTEDDDPADGVPAAPLVPRLRVHGRRQQRRRRFLQDRVDVGSAEAKGADADPPRDTRGDGPRFGSSLDGEVGVAQGQRRIQGRDAQGRDEALVMQAEHRFEQAGASGRGLEVSDVGLHAAEGGSVGKAADRVDQRSHLGAVADGGAGAVGFDHRDGLRVDPGVVIRPLDRPRLAPRVGCGDALSAAVAGPADAFDDGVHFQAEAVREAAPHQDHRGGAFAHDKAVGGLVERPRADRRQRPDLRELHVALGPHHPVSAPDQRRLVAVGQQALDGHLHGRQRGRAGGVDDPARAPQVEGPGDPAGDAVRQLARHRVFTDGGGAGDQIGLEPLEQSGPGCGRELGGLVVDRLGQRGAEPARVDSARASQALLAALGVAQDHGTVLAWEVVAQGARVFQGLLSGDQGDLMAGVQVRDHARWDPVALAVEADVADEGADAAVCPVGDRAVRVVDDAGGQMARVGFADRAAASQQVVPERRDVGRVGEHAAEADHDDLVRVAFRLNDRTWRASREGAVELGQGRRPGRQRDGLTRVKEARLLLGCVVDTLERRAPHRVDRGDPLRLRGRTQAAQVIALERVLLLAQRQPVVAAIPLSRGHRPSCRRRKHPGRRAYGLAHHDGLLGGQDRGLVARAHGAGRDGLLGHQVGGPGLQPERDAALVQPMPQRRHRPSRGRVGDPSSGDHGEVGDRDGACVERALDRPDRQLPQGQPTERTDVTASLVSFQDDPGDSGLQGCREEAGGRGVEVRGEARPLQPERLLDGPGCDHHERRAQALEQGDVGVAVRVRVHADDARSEGQVTARLGGLDQRRLGDMGRHVG